ncbi:MAG: hydrogenase maturation protease [Acidobacteriia bacterium]|nr:hydrogenase maturation protease [Terriglobia bacterium]
MTSSRGNSFEDRAPFLVLGLGNTLLSDDGIGPALIDQLLHEDQRWKNSIEFLDGGTQGLALLGHLSGREGIIILDALAMGAPPGTTRILNLSEVFQMGARRAATSHEGNAGELLTVAKFLDELPDLVFVVGVEPQSTATGYGLSESVRNALPVAADRVRELLAELNCPSLFKASPELSAMDRYDGKGASEKPA